MAQSTHQAAVVFTTFGRLLSRGIVVSTLHFHSKKNMSASWNSQISHWWFWCSRDLKAVTVGVKFFQPTGELMNVTDPRVEPAHPHEDWSVIREVSVLPLYLLWTVFALKVSIIGLRSTPSLSPGHWCRRHWTYLPRLHSWKGLLGVKDSKKSLPKCLHSLSFILLTH